MDAREAARRIERIRRNEADVARLGLLCGINPGHVPGWSPEFREALDFRTYVDALIDIAYPGWRAAMDAAYPPRKLPSYVPRRPPRRRRRWNRW